MASERGVLREEEKRGVARTISPISLHVSSGLCVRIVRLQIERIADGRTAERLWSVRIGCRMSSRLFVARKMRRQDSLSTIWDNGQVPGACSEQKADGRTPAVSGEM